MKEERFACWFLSDAGSVHCYHGNDVSLSGSGVCRVSMEFYSSMTAA